MINVVVYGTIIYVSHPPSIKHLLNGPKMCKSLSKPSFFGGMEYSEMSFFFSAAS